ncbi:hypothetical protein EDD75_0337 [Thermodesulfitimonas autotrophica]|uniref:Uncharacterized protein n=1 Tax=Thermodesulfitimonas autotrophica TaxID=1894989 RepID=A0A3N5C048_9THEO|nr:hypothetical protein [Thermodesulfitimonas autotrophica]RPF49521.1 hypothetical protein EDD75_0337 [Thermodesulfitimonas autotrophica]
MMSIFDHSRDFLKKHYVEVEKLRCAVWEELEKVENELEQWGELKPEERTVLAQASYSNGVLRVVLKDYLPKKSEVLHNSHLRLFYTYPVAEAVRTLTEKLGCTIFFEKAACLIVTYLPRKGRWDPDNRAIGSLINGLRFAGVVQGDSWDQLIFTVIGKVDEKHPRTEIFVADQEKVLPSLLNAFDVSVN